jgi:cullin family protein
VDWGNTTEPSQGDSCSRACGGPMLYLRRDIVHRVYLLADACPAVRFRRPPLLHRLPLRQELEKYVASFERYYKSKHDSQKLSWLGSLSSGVVFLHTSGPKKRTYQLSVWQTQVLYKYKCTRIRACRITLRAKIHTCHSLHDHSGAHCSTRTHHRWRSC